MMARTDTSLNLVIKQTKDELDYIRIEGPGKSLIVLLQQEKENLWADR